MILTISIVSNAQESTTFFQNVAITDMDAVKNQNGTFQYSLTLTDFSGKEILPAGFGLYGYIFADDGKNGDKKANDGIYTARQKRNINILKNNPIKNTTFYDSSFRHQNRLVGSSNQRIGISCKVEKCGCPCSNGNNCGACSQLGWSSWMITECEVDLTIL